MDSKRWQRIKELLHSALEREPGERIRFLNEACAGDSSLRNEVVSLIAAHEQVGGFIESPAFEIMANSLGDETESFEGQAFRPYHIIARVGAGGMGEVYLAEDTRLGRKVALKVLPLTFPETMNGYAASSRSRGPPQRLITQTSSPFTKSEK